MYMYMYMRKLTELIILARLLRNLVVEEKTLVLALVFVVFVVVEEILRVVKE